jgi:lysophospholipase L1-like esterase
MRIFPKALLAAGVALALSACGGSSMTGPSRIPTHTVNVVLYYDQNNNGVLDVADGARIPNATVTIGGASGRTDMTGRAVVPGVPEGTQTATVTADSLPPYYEVPPLALGVPTTGDVLLRATLPLAGNVVRNKYMAFGDSISYGTYEEPLETQLRGYFGAAQVVDDGASGTRSEAGAHRIGESLDYARPAHTLIMYGTNDWNDLACKDSRFPCFTIDSLRAMVHEVKSAGGLAYLATLPPVNVGFNFQAPPEREDWTKRMNDLIRKLARDENVVLVDIYKALIATPDIKSIYDDYVHPNRQGQRLMAQEFFKALTQRQPVTTTSRSPFALHFSTPE